MARKGRKRSRWGDAPAATETEAAPAATDGKKSASVEDDSTNGTVAAMDPKKAKALALQESVRARLAALKQSKKRPTPDAASEPQQQRPIKKAKHYELDLSTTGPTYQKDTAAIPKQPKKKINPYLAHQEEQEDNKANKDEQQQQQQQQLSKDQEKEEAQDERLVRSSKPRQRHKAISFVEPGTFIEIAERKRQRAANAEQSGFVSGRKTGLYVESTGMANVYGGGAGGTLQEDDNDTESHLLQQTHMPLIMEWWDMELLPSKLKKEVAVQEGKALSTESRAQLQQLSSSSPNATADQDDSKQEQEEAMKKLQQLRTTCWDQASLSNSKTSKLVQHIVPIRPPGASSETVKQPTLHLTKKELKRQRKLRRAKKQRELQDMQAAGLIPPPEPRLTLKNFIKVLGDQAVLDPSQMEQKVNEQIQARQRAHLERNEAKKLSKEQLREKKLAKLAKDTTSTGGGVNLAIFVVNDMSHPYHRTKVDLNAQQNNITGGVLECLGNPKLACIIVEGGPKAIKRYTRLMMVRMKWTGTDDLLEEEEDDKKEGGEGEDTPNHKFNPDNKCELVWTGMGAKRMFSSFSFQKCNSGMEARKVLEAKNVAHFWDVITAHHVSSGRGGDESFHLRLVESDEEEEKIVMMEE